MNAHARLHKTSYHMIYASHEVISPGLISAAPPTNSKAERSRLELGFSEAARHRFSPRLNFISHIAGTPDAQPKLSIRRLACIKDFASLLYSRFSLIDDVNCQFHAAGRERHVKASDAAARARDLMQLKWARIHTPREPHKFSARKARRMR